MNVHTITVDNQFRFRLVFESDAEVKVVMANLKKAIEKDIKKDETAHINLQYWVHYDEEGLVGFEVTRARFSLERAFINVEFIATAK